MSESLDDSHVHEDEGLRKLESTVDDSSSAQSLTISLDEYSICSSDYVSSINEEDSTSGNDLTHKDRQILHVMGRLAMNQ